MKRGQGCWLWDHQNHRYLDFICGLGTNLLGYANTQVNAAIIDQLPHGASHSLGTHHEIEAAEKLKEMFPFVGGVKFLKTGTEACAAAIRIARAVTEKDIILSEGYHGWSDDFVSLTAPAYGVPKILDEEDRRMRPIFPLKGRSVAGCAAVIVEPFITDCSRERIEELKTLREECTKHGALLIFDEVITGFRFPKFSVSSYLGITPDIIVLGKAIANGMPLAAVGVTREVKLNPVEYFVSSSYAGETLSLVAAKKTMELLQTKNDINWLWKQGQAFLDFFNELCPQKIMITGYPTRGAFVGDPMTKALFFQEACLAGMLFGPSFFLSFPAAEELMNCQGAIRAIMGRIQRGEVQLKGEMPRSPFAAQIRAGGTK